MTLGLPRRLPASEGHRGTNGQTHVYWLQRYAFGRRDGSKFKRIAINSLGRDVGDAGYCLSPCCADSFLATARTTTTIEDATLNQPLADQPCAAFEAWFLDPACSKPHAKESRSERSII